MHETGFLENEDRGWGIGDEAHELLPVATTKQEIENKGKHLVYSVRKYNIQYMWYSSQYIYILNQALTTINIHKAPTLQVCV